MKKEKSSSLKEIVDLIGEKSKDLKEKMEILNDDLDKAINRSPSKAILSWRLIKIRKRQIALKREVFELGQIEKEFSKFLDRLEKKYEYR